MVIASLSRENISIFSFFETEKIFLFKRKDFFSETNEKYLEKQPHQRLFPLSGSMSLHLQNKIPLAAREILPPFLRFRDLQT